MYNNKKSKQLDNVKTAAPSPDKCQISTCNNDTTVAFMRVFNKHTNKTEIGAFGGHDNGMGNKSRAYGYMNGKDIVMGDQFDFIGWITRCGSCYQQDLTRSGKSSSQICVEQKKAMSE